MKTKFVVIMFLALLVGSCAQFNEQDAKAIIKDRVKHCIKVDLVHTSILGDTKVYVAIDSVYNSYTFEVYNGQVKCTYKNGEKVK